VENAVRLDRGDLDALAQAARRHGVTVACGIHERDDAGSGGTLYNACVIYGPDGTLLNRHRKLMPTNPERMVWGAGDASGLRSVDTPCGRLGALMCWENYMPLARAALYAAGIDVYLAPTYDCGDTWIASLRHIAREGACYVVGAGVALEASDLPADLPGRAILYPNPEEWINDGDSAVAAPDGSIVAGPLRRRKGILYAEIDPGRIVSARRILDVTGHYARPDIFELDVDRRRRRAATFADDEPADTGPGD